VIVRGARNQVFIDRTLARGDTYRVPNRPGLRLTVDDAGAVEIMLDGASVGFVGEPGVAVRGLTLSPPSIAERQKRA
jgi:cytoskeleton protein RodZ